MKVFQGWLADEKKIRWLRLLPPNRGHCAQSQKCRICSTILNGKVCVVLSNQTLPFKTFQEYSWRFHIEETFLNDEFNGEAPPFVSPPALFYKALRCLSYCLAAANSNAVVALAVCSLAKSASAM